MPSQHSYFHIRCRGQVVRQRSAKPSLPSSNLGGTSIVAADCISFAATFYVSHKKSLLTHSVAAPLKIVTARAGSRFCSFEFDLSGTRSANELPGQDNLLLGQNQYREQEKSVKRQGKISSPAFLRVLILAWDWDSYCGFPFTMVKISPP